jgi:cation/acetate symporter
MAYYSSKKTNNASDFYTAGGGLTAWQNGLAVAGNFMSALIFSGFLGHSRFLVSN